MLCFGLVVCCNLVMSCNVLLFLFNDALYYFYGAETTGFSGVLNSYGIIWLWQIAAFGYYVLYKIFGLHWLGWHIAFCSLFAYNAFLLYRLFAHYTSLFSEKIAFFVALLFLISPFQTEVLAWGGCLHYILIVTFLLLGFISLIKYFTEQRTKDLIYFQLLLACSLWCFEQAFLFPFLFFLISYFIIPLQLSISINKVNTIFFISTW